MCLLSIPTPHVSFTSIISSKMIISQLGHLSLLKLQKMTLNLSSLSFLGYESYQLGKNTCSIFPKRVNIRATSMFEIIYSNIWGPGHVSSSLGFLYFLTLIDDYSQCTLLFVRKNRSELLSIFQEFFVKISNRFGISIQKLINDNA